MAINYNYENLIALFMAFYIEQFIQKLLILWKKNYRNIVAWFNKLLIYVKQPSFHDIFHF